jgi:hypothetical protein
MNVSDCDPDNSPVRQGPHRASLCQMPARDLRPLRPVAADHETLHGLCASGILFRATELQIGPSFAPFFDFRDPTR